ncbi:MAG TPA: GGDEF domain-containing protein, partial [Hyphomicrobiales bacterium]|nr:GGDEF domain-containing protein [Hyphomicrobiales bacterium]
AAAIWDRTLPLLAVLLGLAAVSLVFIAMRYGRALAALHRSEAQNRFLALHDALTGLANRLHFDRALEDIIAEGAQDRCAILCVDLDRFKAVNDTYGHQAGDAVIVTVAHRIAETVGGAGLVARVGGDEFIVLLRDGLERDNVLWLCDSVIERVCEAVVFDGGSANVGASIGVAWWPDDALTAKTVIRSADEALYRAKEEGRGRAYLAGETGARAAGVETAAA